MWLVELLNQGRGIPDSGLESKASLSSSPVSTRGRRLKERRDERGYRKTNQHYVFAQEDSLKVVPRNGEKEDGKFWAESNSSITYLCYLTHSHNSQGLQSWRDLSPRQGNSAHHCYSTPIHLHWAHSPIGDGVW